MSFSALPIGESTVNGEPAGSDSLHKRLELLLLVGGNVEQPVSSLERAGRRCREVVVPHGGRLVAGDEKVGDDPTHRRQRAIEHGNVDERAFSRIASTN